MARAVTEARSKIADAWLVLRAFSDLIRIDAAFQRSGFWPVLSRLERWDDFEVERVPLRDIRRAQRFGRRIGQASTWCLPRVQCLHRSVVLHGWLLREGVPSELCIGVLKDGDELKAHAWVEVAGQIVNDTHGAISTFVLLLRQGPNGNSPDVVPSSLLDNGRVQWQ